MTRPENRKRTPSSAVQINRRPSRGVTAAGML